MSYQEADAESVTEGHRNSTLVSAGGWHPPVGQGGIDSPKIQFEPASSQPVFGQNLPAQPVAGTLYVCACFGANLTILSGRGSTFWFDAVATQIGLGQLLVTKRLLLFAAMEGPASWHPTSLHLGDTFACSASGHGEQTVQSSSQANWLRLSMPPFCGEARHSSLVTSKDFKAVATKAVP
eukprot:GHUV01006270.1.p2 GENE.GHUV01006270.1~~GHUV01006270.1.p2  ORF type:complete len:180 (-),score=12.40 GHUV01006270.1:201-740(-)